MNWKVIAFSVRGAKHWFVYRVKNGKPDEAGNRIYKGGHFESERDAKEYADWLNVYGNEIR